MNCKSLCQNMNFCPKICLLLKHNILMSKLWSIDLKFGTFLQMYYLIWNKNGLLATCVCKLVFKKVRKFFDSKSWILHIFERFVKRMLLHRKKVLIRLQTCCLDTRYLGSVKLMSRFLSNKVDTRCCCLYCRLKSFLRSAIKHAFSISRNVTELFWLFIFWNDKKHGLLSLSQTTWPFLFRKCRYFPKMFV